MKTLLLSEADYALLCYMLGLYMGSGLEMTEETRALTDWVMIQGDKHAYTYFHDKAALRRGKLEQLLTEAT